MRGSLRARIVVGLAVIVGTLVIVSVVLVTSLTRLGGAIAVILRENYASVVACEDMKEALEREDSAAQFASTGHADIAGPMLASNRVAFAVAFDREAHNITLPGERERVERIDRLHRGYRSMVDRALQSPERADLYFRELLPRFTEIKDEIQAVLRLNQQNMEDADGHAKALAARSLRIDLAVTAIALLFAVGFLWRLPGSVVRPVSALADVARAAGEGRLEARVETPEVRELVPLADALRKTLEQLRVYRESSLGELLEARDLAHATIECLLDPVVVLGRQGDVLLTNHAAETAFGLRVGSAAELRSDNAVIPEPFIAARDRVFSTGGAVFARNFNEAMRWSTRGGDEFYLVRAAPLRGEAPSPLRAIVVAQNVTRFRRIDDLKTDMVATVSHEFKTPLTSLRMATHLLLEPGTGPLTEGQREIVTTARDDTERLRAMVDELLDLVRIEAEAGELRRAMVDPRQLLRGVLEAHRAIARDKGVELTLEEAPAVERALVDPEKLTIVLSNLVSNAIRHTPAGGRVSMDVTREGATLRLQVRDTGEGIAAEALPRLLERPSGAPGPIVQRDQHGLGLTIAREIVLQHGGELLANSARGRGSTFTVLLPIDD